MIKPQFEVGQAKIGKGGIVRDDDARKAACRDVMNWIDTQSEWSVSRLIESPITGGDGNREFLLAAEK